MKYQVFTYITDLEERMKNDSIQAELQLTLNIYPAPKSVFQLYTVGGQEKSAGAITLLRARGFTS